MVLLEPRQLIGGNRAMCGILQVPDCLMRVFRPACSNDKTESQSDSKEYDEEAGVRDPEHAEVPTDSSTQSRTPITSRTLNPVKAVHEKRCFRSSVCLTLVSRPV